MVLFDVAPPLRSRGLSAFGPHTTFEFGELSLHVGAEIAFAHALARTDNDDDFAVRVTFGFEKRAGCWAIVHEHHSVPLT